MASNRIRRSKHTDKASGKKAEVRLWGERLASFGSNFVVVRIGNTSSARTLKKMDGARMLVLKAAQALEHPGLVRGAVFRKTRPSSVFAYSIYSKDPTKVVREAANGKRVIGRLISGKFKSE